MGALIAAVTVLAACGSSGAGAAPPTTPPPSASPAAGTAAVEGPFGGPSAADSAAGGPSVFTPVTASVLRAPIPVPATDGRVHLAYELELTNVLSSPVTINTVEVVGDGRSLLRLEGDALAEWIKPFGGSPGTRDLTAGQGGLVWLDVVLAPTDPVPARLEHRLDLAFAQPSPPLVPPTLTATLAASAVDRTPPIRISPPLRGPGWLDGDSCCRLGAHRGAVSPIDGQLWAPERFAIDYVQTDAAGRMMTGPPTDIASYPYVGADILAVADGPVVGLVSDLPQQPPGANPGGLTLQQYGGNHVVQDLGGGRYAFYAHLQTGNPLNLAVGQQLRRGQVLGKLGNSGNSDAPHLHFHVMDRPDPLASNGVPFEFDAFTLDGRVVSEESLQQGTAGPVPFGIDRAGAGPRAGVSPLGLDVMSYPAAP
ncbi:M23 family metallopeptidase [Actinomycetospora straminea]|uniref:M23 family metallopeptidase n=1 Tax=Actinomycetospora straminea TaxID=663607 RepID=UPI002365A5A2|nr:M23 family metallopeptidase [Actinomycetospora straminea]MDD7931883.1 M23 family metallopeptidase [Actinomycetospora straminea]